MVIVTCLEKRIHPRLKIKQYLVEDRLGNVILISHDKLAFFLTHNQMKCTNLQVDSLGRILDKAREYGKL